MRRSARAAVAVAAAALTFSVPAGAQNASDAALAVPVNGHIVITDMGRAETHIVPTPVVSGGSTSQREDLDITMPVLGLPLEGQTSLIMEAHMTMVLVSASTTAQGKAPHVVLHGPAGDADVSITIDQPVQGMGGYDPADATVHIRGAGGTGMFSNVRIQADLKGAFKPSGTLYLGYASPDAALAAIERGLAQNAALSATERTRFLTQARQALTNAAVDVFPAEQTAGPGGPRGAPPAQAAVTSAVRRSGAETQLILRIVVPQGPVHQPVKVIRVDDTGAEHTSELGTHAPGETVSASAAGTPPFIVLVYVNDVMVKQISVTAQ
jgi:hypothetical protein